MCETQVQLSNNHLQKFCVHVSLDYCHLKSILISDLFGYVDFTLQCWMFYANLGCKKVQNRKIQLLTLHCKHIMEVQTCKDKQTKWKIETKSKIMLDTVDRKWEVGQCLKFISFTCVKQQKVTFKRSNSNMYVCKSQILWLGVWQIFRGYCPWMNNMDLKSFTLCCNWHVVAMI